MSSSLVVLETVGRMAERNAPHTTESSYEQLKGIVRYVVEEEWKHEKNLSSVTKTTSFNIRKARWAMLSFSDSSAAVEQLNSAIHVEHDELTAASIDWADTFGSLAFGERKLSVQDRNSVKQRFF